MWNKEILQFICLRRVSFAVICVADPDPLGSALFWPPLDSNPHWKCGSGCRRIKIVPKENFTTSDFFWASALFRKGRMGLKTVKSWYCIGNLLCPSFRDIKRHCGCRGKSFGSKAGFFLLECGTNTMDGWNLRYIKQVFYICKFD